jgi:DNA-directed RNA polymerase specialized sigma24 family protein
MNAAAALCEAQGEALRRALAVAFEDEALAARSTASAFAGAHRRWRTLASRPDPMAWVDVTAVRAARRRLAALERRWRPVDDEPAGLSALPPRARVAVVLHSLRGRAPDDIAVALWTSRAEVGGLLRDAYRALGVIDVVIDDDEVPYAR